MIHDDGVIPIIDLSAVPSDEQIVTSPTGKYQLRLLQDRDEAVALVEPTFIARTSDRILFRKCRRLWGWMSVNGQGRKMRTEADYFWFGTGMHFALEDYHGLNIYGHPTIAFKAYQMATMAANRCPATWRSLETLGMAMMSYYGEIWLRHREPLKTFVWNGKPQVEVNARIDLGKYDQQGRRIMYGFTLDRVIEDEFGQLWIVEYKSAKSFRLHHFDVDDQITAYCWAAWYLYGKPVAGVIYQQHKKSLPAPPKILSTGRVSHDKRQSTSAALYGEMLRQFYGSVEKAPNQNILMWNALISEEDEDKDRFIRRDKIERSPEQLQSFEEKLFMELEDMTRPNLALYPNPSKDCEWACPLQGACVALDRKEDFDQYLDAYTYMAHTVAEEQLKWRKLLPPLEQVNLPPESLQYNSLVQQLQVLEPESAQQSSPESPMASPTESFLEELGVL
jgi:hypothetical protein